MQRRALCRREWWSRRTLLGSLRCRVTDYTQHRGTEDTEDHREPQRTTENHREPQRKPKPNLDSFDSVFSVFLCVLRASVLRCTGLSYSHPLLLLSRAHMQMRIRLMCSRFRIAHMD